MALIESLLKRPNGTKVQFGTKSYHFKPDESGRHVATVTEESHIKALLAIPEGYSLAENEARSLTPALSTIPPQPIADDGAPMVFGTGGTDPAGDTTKPNDDNTGIGTGTGTGNPEGGTSGTETESDLDKARADYVAKFQKKPHHTWSVEVIRQKLAED